MGTEPTGNGDKGPALRSDFANDPDMREILELFVQEMPTRVSDLLVFWEQQELEKVGRMAHQLKGAGGGYGFEIISTAAAALEKSVSELKEAPTTSMIEATKAQVDTLVDLCKRASAQ